MEWKEHKDLKARMKQAGLDYRDLANLLGESPTTVANRLNGWSTLDDQRRHKIVSLIEEKEGVPM